MIAFAGAIGCGDDSGTVVAGTEGGSSTGDEATPTSGEPWIPTPDPTVDSDGPVSTTTEWPNPGTTDIPTTVTSGIDPSGVDSTTDDPSMNGGSSSTSDGESSTGSTGGTTEEPVDPFGPPEAFGDDVLELDLVGSWGLHWSSEADGNTILDIETDGSFVWTEILPGCAAQRHREGVLWVEGSQIVFHVEHWEGPLPWDTLAQTGQEFDPPFRLRLSFSMQGSVGDSYLALTAPGGITEATPYSGQSYTQLEVEGQYLGGLWTGEAELQAVPDGEDAPVVIVRDVLRAYTEPEVDPSVAEGTGEWSRTRTFYWPDPVQDITYANFNWTCLDGCPQPAGTTLVAGSNLYTYGPYGGARHLMNFASGRAFRLGVTAGCPL